MEIKITLAPCVVMTVVWLVIFFWTCYYITGVGMFVEKQELVEIHKFRRRDMFPAGMDWDADHDRFILGSLTEPSLFTLSPNGKLDLFLTVSDHYDKGIFGVRMDNERNRVLAVVTSFVTKTQGLQGGENGETPFEALVGYDLETKARVLYARLDTVVSRKDQKPQANSVVVDLFGNAFVTNSVDNFIWKVTTEGNVTIFTEDSQLKSQVVPTPEDPATWGLSAIAYGNGGDNFVVIRNNPAQLFLVNSSSAEVLPLMRLNEGAYGANYRFMTQTRRWYGDVYRGILAVISNSSVSELSYCETYEKTPFVHFECENRVISRFALDSSCFPIGVAIQRSKHYVACSHLGDLLQRRSRDDFSINMIKFQADTYRYLTNKQHWQFLWVYLVMVLAGIPSMCYLCLRIAKTDTRPRIFDVVATPVTTTYFVRGEEGEEEE